MGKVTVMFTAEAESYDAALEMLKEYVLAYRKTGGVLKAKVRLPGGKRMKVEAELRPERD